MYNENLFSIIMWYIMLVIYLMKEIILPFDTWVRSASEANQLASYGIIVCTYIKWNIHIMYNIPSTEPITLICGFNVKTEFVSTENMTQKHVKMVLADRKRMSLEESD